MLTPTSQSDDCLLLTPIVRKEVFQETLNFLGLNLPSSDKKKSFLKIQFHKKYKANVTRWFLINFYIVEAIVSHKDIKRPIVTVLLLGNGLTMEKKFNLGY